LRGDAPLPRVHTQPDLLTVMAYQALARKWRPRNLEQVAGQAHILKVLSNALTHGRLHHAYLFSGERGVGKTTLARILAKCLNCEAGVTAQPCGQCAACMEIDEGRFIDLIEVDAASRTKVEDTRDLLENVQYLPTRGRFKIYLIDEVHMLSNHSFNALLKTLEEPPEHVKFLLATTEAQRLPVTVLSRCLQLNLKRLSKTAIADQMLLILEAEKAVFEPAAVTAIARAADGSMRDALSLLDQALAYGGNSLREAEVHDMLGTAPRESWRALVSSLQASDVNGTLGAVARLAEQAADFAETLDELLTLFHQAALAQVCPEALYEHDEGRELALGFAQAITAENLQLYYQTALIGKRDLPLAPDARVGFEMIVLRMLRFALMPSEGAWPQKRATEAGSKPRPVLAAPTQSIPPPVSAHTSGAFDWAALISSLGLKGLPDTLARNCTFGAIAGDEIRLTLSEVHAELCTDKAQKRLQEALSAKLGRPMRLRIDIGAQSAETPIKAVEREAKERLAAAREAIESDPLVRELQDRFGARLVEGSVRIKSPAAGDEGEERR
jgi:DNA polymerase III subunit gamma/tau